MGFEARSYSGKQQRPSPEVQIEDDGSFGVIVTAWGSRQTAKRTIEMLRDYTLSARQDMEATSPFQKLTCLSPLANNLRVAVMLANDALYREDNKSEHLCGVELLVFAHDKGEFAYAQVGLPHLLLARPGSKWIPISVQMDLATEFSEPPELLSPLPHNLLGLHTTSNMNVSSFKIKEGDRLVFVSHSLGQEVLASVASENASLDLVTSALAQAHPEHPFWLGVFELSRRP